MRAAESFGSCRRCRRNQCSINASTRRWHERVIGRYRKAASPNATRSRSRWRWAWGACGPRVVRQRVDGRADLFVLIGYAVVYTVYLKRATPQNIVIGGAPALSPGARLTAVTVPSIPMRCCCFSSSSPDTAALLGARDRAPLRLRARDIPMLPVTPAWRSRVVRRLLPILLLIVTILPRSRA